MCQSDMDKLYAVAMRDSNAGNGQPWSGSNGFCFKYVANYIDAAGYAGIPYGYYYEGKAAYARQFAEIFNQPRYQQKYGIKRLPITNPFNAPKGAIIVVGAGSPG